MIRYTSCQVAELQKFLLDRRQEGTLFIYLFQNMAWSDLQKKHCPITQWKKPSLNITLVYEVWLSAPQYLILYDSDSTNLQPTSLAKCLVTRPQTKAPSAIYQMTITTSSLVDRKRVHTTSTTRATRCSRWTGWRTPRQESRWTSCPSSPTESWARWSSWSDCSGTPWRWGPFSDGRLSGRTGWLTLTSSGSPSRIQVSSSVYGFFGR